MRYYTLHHKTTKQTLYAGRFQTLAACVEASLSDKANLSGVNLRGHNLAGASFDGAKLDGADFSNSNLAGCNFSEGSARKADFSGANLVDACLCKTDLTESSFLQSRFGATDIADADLSLCLFAGLSCFKLDFILVGRLSGATYLHSNGAGYAMSTPPRVISNLFTTPVIITDDAVLIGPRAFSSRAKQTHELLGMALRNHYDRRAA